jgi:hypothetical protein
VRPHRFEIVGDLGTYSYVENKVFPLDGVRGSGIVKPLLRKIAQYTFRGQQRRVRGRTLATVEGSGGTVLLGRKRVGGFVSESTPVET